MAAVNGATIDHRPGSNQERAHVVSLRRLESDALRRRLRHGWRSHWHPEFERDVVVIRRGATMTGAINAAQTILIVDDDPPVARMFERYVVSAGYAALVATTAEEAMRHLDARRIDVVITDLRMPFIDGFLLLYHLRSSEAHKHIPVIIVTGDTALTRDELEELAGLAATVRYKPIEAHELLEDIGRVLSREH
jgi:two-component system chemotaxis response regulator CheY